MYHRQMRSSNFHCCRAYIACLVLSSKDVLQQRNPRCTWTQPFSCNCTVQQQPFFSSEIDPLYPFLSFTLLKLRKRKFTDPWVVPTEVFHCGFFLLFCFDVSFFNKYICFVFLSFFFFSLLFFIVEKHHFPLDGDRTLDHFVLQKDTDNQEHKVKPKHEETQDFIHPPLAGSNGEDDKEQHDEEEDNRTEQTIAADCHRGKTVNYSIQEPWKRKAVKKQKK